MSINNNYSLLARSVKTIINPSKPIGTLIEEVPTDIGRSYAGYKRGGIIEGAEKMRKELMSAVVWMFGIPAFNKIGNLICEKLLKIPTTGIDFSNAKKGNDSILDSAKYLIDGVKKDGLDYSDLEKFKNFDFKGINAEQLAKRMSTAKKVTSISALILNCVMMGIAIPKINQYLTEKKLGKQNKTENEPLQNFTSFEDFQKNTTNKTSNPVSFKGIPRNIDDLTYQTENDNRFRLIITDVPMIIGRMITSRNKYEALEYLIMDGASAYFYNFASGHVQKLLRGKTTPNIQPISAETLVNNFGSFKEGLEKIRNNPDIFKTPKGERPDSVLKNIFGSDVACEIYRNETYGKYGKVNKFTENDTLKDINKSIESFVNKLQSQAKKENIDILKGDKTSLDFIKKYTKRTNIKNAGFLAIGLATSVLGLSIIIPKLTFAVTKLLTGKNEFTGSTSFEENDNTKKKA